MPKLRLFTLFRGSRRLKIKHKLILSFFFLFIVPILVVGISTYYYFNNGLSYKVSTYSEEIISQLGQNIDLELDGFIKAASEAAFSDYLIENLSIYSDSNLTDKFFISENINSKVLRPKFISPYITDVMFVTTKNSKMGLRGSRDGNYGYFWNDETISKVKELIDNGTNPVILLEKSAISENNIVIGRPVKTKGSQQLIGYMFVAISEKYFSNIYSKADFGSKSTNTFIIDSNGYIISSISKDIPTGSQFKESLLMPSILKNTGHSLTMSLGGKKNLVVYSKINSSPGWYLVSTIPYNDVIQNESNVIFKNIFIIISLFFVIAILVLLIVLRSLVMPFKKLSALMQSVGMIEKGGLSTRIDEIFHDEIGELSFSFQKMLHTLDNMWKEVTDSRDIIAQWNKSLEQTVQRKTSEISNILDNAGQGFLTFGEDLAINDEYSVECENIFQEQIKGKSFPKLLYRDDYVMEKAIESLFIKLLKEKDPTKRSQYIFQLPDEAMISGKHVHIEYKIIDDLDNSESQKVMTVLTDKTEEYLIEIQMEKEETTLKMVVNAVAHYNEFIRGISDFRDFFEDGIYRIVDDRFLIEDKLGKIIKNIHVFKNFFLDFSMMDTLNKLEDLENSLIENCNESMDSPDHSELLNNIIKECGFERVIEDDLSTLRKILGEKFFNQENKVIVDKSTIVNIEKIVKSHLTYAEYRHLLPDIMKLRFKPFSDLIKPFTRYILKLADKLEKQVTPLSIEGDEILVDTSRYSHVSKSLVHIFRNIIDHGIETPDERMEIGKDAYGNISCKLENIDDKYISISISDDGRGIDIDKLTRNAVSKGIISASDLDAVSNNDLLNLIFVEGLSTRENITELSGRGIGLSSVKKGVEKVGGTIKVSTTQGKGTEFKIILPLLDHEVESTAYETEDMLNLLVKNLSHSLMESTGVDFRDYKDIKFARPEKVHFRNITTTVNIKGFFEGTLVISANDTLAKSIISNSCPDASSEEAVKYIKDILIKCSTDSLDNTLKLFNKPATRIELSPTYSMTSENAIVKYNSADIWACDINCNEGIVSLSLIIANNY